LLRRWCLFNLDGKVDRKKMSTLTGNLIVATDLRASALICI